MDTTASRCATGKVRLFVEAPLGAGLSVTLDRDQRHYAVNVMRLAQGDALLLFNGADGEWRARIDAVTRRDAVLSCERQTRPQEPLPDLWLLFAPVKKARVDFIAQKATEMGVSLLQPVLTERTAVGRVNTGRLQVNAREAAEQCGLVGVPEVAPARALSALLDHWDEEAADRHIVFCDETAECGRALDSLQALKETLGAAPPLAVLIGPEGGFSAAERDRLKARRGTTALSLGPRIMRADTAAIAALAAVQLVLGDWSDGC